MSVDLVGLVNQLRSTLGKMEVALGAIADAIVWTGDDGSVQWCNAAFDKLVNRSHILVLGSKLSELLPLRQAGQPIALSDYPDVRTLRGEYAVTEYEVELSDRSAILEISGNCVGLDDDNTPPESRCNRLAVLVIRDVTPMKRLEADRQQAEREREETIGFLQATLNSTADGIFLIAPDGNVPIFNQKFLQMWSMPESLLLSGTEEERLTFLASQVSDPDSFRAKVREQPPNHSNEEPYDLVELKNGRVFECYIQPQWQGQKYTGRLWSFRDITRTKHAEAEQQQAEHQVQQLLALMRATLESMDEAVLVITTPERRTPIYNRKFLEMWSMPEELMQQTAADAEPSQETARFKWQIEQTKDPQAFSNRVWELFRDRPTETALDLIEMKDGRIIERLAQPLWSNHQSLGRVWTFRDVTEARRTEQALREREAKFRSLVENANDLIFAINSEGVFFYVSPNSQNIVGFSPVELEGSSFMPFVHPDDVQQCLDAVSHVTMTGEGLANIEYRGKHRDGSWRWLMASLAAPQEVNGRLLIVGVARDVTDRKQTEEALRQSELRFQAIFENATIGTVLAGPDSTTLQVNPAMQRTLGYSEAELCTMKFADYTHPEDVAQSSELRQQVFAGLRDSCQMEKRYIRKDGSVFWARLTLSPIRDQEGNTRFMLALIENINDRKQAEEALQQSEARYRALVTATAQAVFTTNAVGEVVDDIPLWCALTGQSEAEAKGFGWLEQVHPDDRDRTLHVWLEALRTKTLYEIEQRVQVASGDYRLFLVRAVPIFDDQGNIREWMGTQTDITDRKQAEAALQLSEQKYRNLFENSQIGIGRTRLEDGLFLDANQRCAEILGFDSPADVIGKCLSQDLYVNPDERQQIIVATEQRGEGRNFELRLRRRDGTEVWVLLSFEWNRASACIDFVLADISDRKQAEAALHQREQEFRTLVENVPATIIRFDRNSRYLFINSQVERETGVPPAAFLGKTVAEMGFPEEIATRWQGILEHVFDTAQDYEAELELPLFGRITYQSFRVVPELNRDGTVASVLAVVRDITESRQREAERKRLEAELLRSQQFLDSVIENIPLGLFVKDAINEFRYVLINQSAEPFLGFSRQDAIGLNDYDLTNAEQAAFYREQDNAVVRQGALLEISEQPTLIKGKERFARILKVPIFDAHHQITHLLCISEDITERTQREEALRLIVEGTAATTSEQFFRSFVQYLAKVMQVQYAIVSEFADAAQTRVRTLAVWQGDAISTSHNSEGIAPNFEYSLAGTPCNLVLNNEFRDVCYYAEQVQAHFPNDPDLVALEAESYLGIPLIDSSGQVLGHVAVIDAKPMPQDRGKELILRIFAARASAELERKQIDDALQRRAEVDGLLSQISRQFIDQNADTAINFTLQAIAQLIGSERSCIFGLTYKPQSYGYLIHEWHIDGIESIPDQVKAGYLDDFPMFKQLLDGNAFQIACVASLPANAPERAVFNPTGTQSVVVVPMIHSGRVVGYLTADVVHFAKTWNQEDLNLMSRIGEMVAIAQARYQAEEALRVAKDAAEAANRAKSTFLANMSHELRTPLNAILGFAQLMRRDPILTQRQQGSLATINRSGEHLLDLINDVLAMSKIEAGRTVLNPVSFDLHRLLQTLQEMFQGRASAKRLSLQFEMDDNLPQYVFTDEGKLRQVLINLLSNAVKFTEVGGVVLRSSRSIGHPLPNDEVTLRFEVEDTGAGIAAAEVKHLFQPFVQTVSSGRSLEGTGLGLAISRQFVRLMGGEISLRSVVGQGALFYFTVQATLANPVEIASPPDDRQVTALAPNQPTYRILAVDDRPENLDLITQLLDQVGFETRTAIDGQGAIAQWQTWQPHLIWMDMRMPRMDGYEATRQIRSLEGSTAHTVIVALTASAFDEQKATIFEAGCDDFVSKPFKAHVIFDKLAEHLGVQYLYEPETPSPLLQKQIEDLNPASIQMMAADWIAELQQAALEADRDRILQLIEQIPPNDANVAQQLTELVQQFGFDEILALTETDNH